MPSKSQIRLLEQKCLHFSISDQKTIFVVINISTISMRQNCSISFSADPGGATNKATHLGHPGYNYNVQSKDRHEFNAKIDLTCTN